MTEKSKNYICSVFFLIFGAFLYVQSLPFKPISGKDLGSGFFPKVLAVGIIITALVELYLTYKSNDQTKDDPSDNDLKGGVLTIACICAYVALYDILGFLISTVAYLFLQMFVLSDEKNRNLKQFAIVSVLSAIVIYVVFNNLIGMSLPDGILEF